MSQHKEGDLFKTVYLYGKVFEIYYGYYEEYERNSIFNDPVPVYPDLASNPEYTDDGCPIVTEMQIACEDYSGRVSNDRCGLCSHFESGEHLFGLCKCKSRKNEK